MTDVIPWHAQAAEDAAASLDADLRGLAAPEVARRLEVHGPNQIEEEPPTPWWVVLLRQFTSPLIYILGVAAIITLLLGEYVDSGVITAVLVLNAAIGFTQERRAESAVRALAQLVVPHARVVRDGREVEIDSRDLVPGDLVLLEPGARIPADLRLTATNGLQVDESMLTGESLPVGKHTDAVPTDAALADRASMAYTGTVVTAGRGRGLVVTTGANTELGAIAGLIRAEEAGETPLQRDMGRFARIVGIVVGVASLVAFLSGLALGGEVDEMFLAAVALAVAAIPEGLPVVFTITLALGVRRMAQRNAIIRRLPAVETLGSTTVIGSDKTGTLTENRMTVQRLWVAGREVTVGSAGIEEQDGTPIDPAAEPALHRTLLAGVLTNEASAHRTADGLDATGDPTEVALLVAAMTAGVEPEQVREDHAVDAEIPFESERRYSASFRTSDGEHAVYVKGAPERLVPMCSQMLTSDGPVPLDAEEVLAASGQLATQGLRVLAMAYRVLASPPDGTGPAPEPDDLVLVGLQGMMDPPRKGVRESVAACHRAGVRVVMITGDHAATARSIAHDLGIAPTDAPVLTGQDLADLEGDDLRDLARTHQVFARVSPEDKLRIVHALQADGHTVAVTGDGVNDAPALRAAELGVAMGRDGTDVAREASDIVLTDDNFVSITAAIEEGRVTFDNVRKVTFFLVSTGAATILAILVGVWAGWPLLMVPAQLLWLNLVTNGLQDLALAFEPGEPGVLDRPPRRRGEGVLSAMLWRRTVLAGIVMATGTLALFQWELLAGASLTRAQTVALSTMVVYMAFHAGNARAGLTSLFRLHPLSNPFLFVATGAAVLVHVLALHWGPTQFVLRVEPLDGATWLRIIAVASTILIAIEVHKWWCRRSDQERRDTGQQTRRDQDDADVPADLPGADRTHQSRLEQGVGSGGEQHDPGAHVGGQAVADQGGRGQGDRVDIRNAAEEPEQRQ
jgi:magnesium-transporting ATPase (P-type)